MTPLFQFCVLCALTYLPLARRPAGLVRSLVKTASVAGLAVSASLAGEFGLATALGLCALGDLLLSRDGDGPFAAGVAAFAAGHVGYISLFLSLPESELSRLPNSPTLVAVLSLLGLGGLMAVLLAPRAGNLRLPVLLYIPIILGMGLAALTLPSSGPLAWVLVAALAFVLSDMTLATERFLLPAGHPALRVMPWVIWVLYWGAQAGFYLVLVQGNG
ncbi:lysoplasmalogenase family protein [Sedimentitalea todarodis]|uniref:Lysoplasmalogenase family protein n=1 Tax=Sedimentitalea todarodis TaxID=1631240 RepID=A0ABU3VFA0_9RHOB|nr:lysoplasmalogenase family protein [Sedimentitalea todarodis]MDU9004861.1 lysoplasmalogenase family protein [Sedimentitalea todarodis]